MILFLNTDVLWRQMQLCWFEIIDQFKTPQLEIPDVENWSQYVVPKQDVRYWSNQMTRTINRKYSVIYQARNNVNRARYTRQITSRTRFPDIIHVACCCRWELTRAAAIKSVMREREFRGWFRQVTSSLILRISFFSSTIEREFREWEIKLRTLIFFFSVNCSWEILGIKKKKIFSSWGRLLQILGRHQGKKV